MEMLERVARAIRTHFDTDMAAEIVARAAIEAMREPTEAMISEAWAMTPAEWGTPPQEACDVGYEAIYQAMIDTALAPRS